MFVVIQYKRVLVTLFQTVPSLILSLSVMDIVIMISNITELRVVMTEETAVNPHVLAGCVAFWAMIAKIHLRQITVMQKTDARRNLSITFTTDCAMVARIIQKSVCGTEETVVQAHVPPMQHSNAVNTVMIV